MPTKVGSRNKNTKHFPKTEVAQITHPKGKEGRPPSKAGAVLSALIREVGDEVVEGSTKQWTRIEAAVRSLYAKALQGDVMAFKELTDRGWGKVPATVEVDVNTRIQQMTLEARFTWEDIKNDPILFELLQQTGLDESMMKQIQPPREVEYVESND